MADDPEAPYPHCDDTILHAPGACVFCDKYPDWQANRIALKINFTGERLPGLDPCPSELRRPLNRINRWPGNTPKSQAYLDAMAEELKKLKHDLGIDEDDLPPEND